LKLKDLQLRAVHRSRRGDPDKCQKE